SLLAGRAFTGSAFCLARARLPLAVFQTVLRELVPDKFGIGDPLPLRVEAIDFFQVVSLLHGRWFLGVRHRHSSKKILAGSSRIDEEELRPPPLSVRKISMVE